MSEMTRRLLSSPKLIAADYTLLVIGATIMALTFNLFLFPNKIASGGVTGASIIVSHVLPIAPALVQWVINIPLFVVALFLLGRRFGLKTLLGSLLLPLFIYATSPLDAVTHDPLLAALFGGIGAGIGLGLVFRGKASTGGTALAAQLIHTYSGITLGASIMVLDGSIVLLSAFVFNIELAMYALISLYVTSKTIDIVQIGFGYAKIALIISEEEQNIRNVLLNDLARGVTRIEGTGGYTEYSRPVLMCVIHRNEVTKMKQLVHLQDSKAFVIVMNANEVLGEGFQ